MRARTEWKGCWNARSTFSPAGRYVWPAATSARRNSPISAMRSETGASASAHPVSTISFRGRPGTARDPISVEPAEFLAVQGDVGDVPVHRELPGAFRHDVPRPHLRGHA